MKNSRFVIIPVEILYSKVSPLAKLLYGELLGHSMANPKEPFSKARNKTLGAAFDVSANTISRLLTQLEKAGFISVKIERNAKGTFREIYPLLQVGKKQAEEAPKEEAPRDQKPAEEKAPPKTPKATKEPKQEKKKIDREELEFFAETVEVLEHLTALCGAEFRLPKAASSFSRYNPYRLIKALLKDEYTLEQIKAVCDLKASEWLNNPKMAIYLRPKTLFRKNNFESYLGQIAIRQKQKQLHGKSTNNHNPQAAGASGEISRLAEERAKIGRTIRR